MRTTSIILIVAAGLIFFGYIDPTYQGTIKPLQSDAAQYSKALNEEAQFSKIRNSLSDTENSFPSEGRTMLEKMLPNTVDNVRLIIDISNLATQYGVKLKNIKINAPSGAANQTGSAIALGVEQNPFGTMLLNFTVSSPYSNFVQFIKGLERSLRIVDVSSISFNSTDVDLYDYSVGIKTYWLK